VKSLIVEEAVTVISVRSAERLIVRRYANAENDLAERKKRNDQDEGHEVPPLTEEQSS